MIFVGNDWAEDHHDVYVMDEAGKKLAAKRFGEGIEGVTALHALLGAHAEDPAQVRVGIETDRGLWVNALVAAGYQVHAINPRAAARYRDRHHVSGAKSDAGDAKMLADLVRTDAHNHRLVAGDSAQVEGVKVIARAHQNLVWSRSRETNRLRSALREYYPAALVAFEDLDHRDALAVLGRAPDPLTGAKLTLSQIKAALRAGGRRRYLDATAERIQEGLRTEQLAAPAPVVEAYAASTKALVGLLVAFNTQIADLETQLEQSFEQHPDADIYLSLPGLSDVLGARVLGELGDDPERFADAKSRRNYAGTSPITKASGKKKIVLARYVRNKRLYDAVDQWAFCSLTGSPGARAYYDERRAADYEHHEALRALGNRWIGILHGCLKHGTPYDEHTAWAHRHHAAA
ncbi:IS110 family RNA-guided transposase [Ornithinimicrobium avium]|uniref:IS110 family transposase n=1 Tax=Ornithinimicrobium avium TaxID=2283195 RepID=A0A345NS61_9MICO|nr:IS110 family transposase [Ornithinimicrobium avium]AXH97869.1 IS110 family transposase [Ornithinimicrobium avium]